MNLKMLVFLILILGACAHHGEPEALARKHCSSCHQFPDPSLLDKNSWKTGVLPEMAFRMGRDISKLPGTNAHELEEILKAIPPLPLVSDEDWQSIEKYYLTIAPDSLAKISHPETLLLDQFSPTRVRLPFSGTTALTMIRSDPYSRKTYIGTRNKKLYIFDPAFTFPLDSFQLGGPPSDIVFVDAGEAIISSMGMMDPNDMATGSISMLSASGNNVRLLIDSLKRPADIEYADLNQDGAADLLISAFGNFTGGLFAFEKTAGGFRKHFIHNLPGNRKTVVRDFNSDGLPDILALISQGNEQVALFTNRGKFRFSYQVLLRFPPVYGSSYIELADFNSDGHPDILYTNGDNADYSAILKPYHGLRLFLNDGKNHFAEKWFLPMHGASMTQAADYDKDGDTDIAAISFFPDFKNHPEHGFLYFQNDRGKFKQFYTPLAASGRWITMESTDIDGDGDTDLLLGSLAFPAKVPENIFTAWAQNEVSMLILENQLVP